jgi:hypothetical protein
MRRCWQLEPSQRPDFFTIQLFFAGMLEDATADYGYLFAVRSKNNLKSEFVTM